MKLPSEKIKKVETIQTGTLTSSSKLDITVDYSKYDKIILEVYSTTNAIQEGTSCVLEVNPEGDGLINKVACFVAYVSATNYELVGHIYYIDSTSLRININRMTGWSNRKYDLKGILK